ncbi:hypothetical protein [Streptomyces roseolilacinus]|uniref:Lipoprotein n=1 Tax=Streptomyces roseolilacinus TaxID=66904 RepID=A0A918EN39_9ACTN|nr:hypothetical protein [Streptomyces roseolilacinus]GGQ28651.1 hypothetical protein GCM10010249_54250 [Streptomyces roseolilacinus]
MQKLVRKGAAVAAVLVSAVALTACGSNGEVAKPGDGGGSAAPSAGASGSAARVALADAEGAWLGVTDGKPVTLTISKGGQAVVISEAHVCQGTAKEGDTLTLALTCKDGNTDRASGTIGSADGKQLVVTWDSGKTDTLAKPAASGLPTNMPSIPALPSLPPQS